VVTVICWKLEAKEEMVRWKEVEVGVYLRDKEMIERTIMASVK